MLVSGVMGKAAGRQEEVGGGGQDEVGRRQACTGAGRVSEGPRIRVRQGKPLPHTG